MSGEPGVCEVPAGCWCLGASSVGVGRRRSVAARAWCWCAGRSARQSTWPPATQYSEREHKKRLRSPSSRRKLPRDEDLLRLAVAVGVLRAPGVVCSPGSQSPECSRCSGGVGGVVLERLLGGLGDGEPQHGVGAHLDKYPRTTLQRAARVAAWKSARSLRIAIPVAPIKHPTIQKPPGDRGVERDPALLWLKTLTSPKQLPFHAPCTCSECAA